MKRFENLTVWLVILGLLLFSAVASAVWLALEDDEVIAEEADDEVVGALFDFDLELPLGDEPPEGETEMVIIDLDNYLLGEALVNLPLIGELNGLVVHPLLITAILAAIFVGGLLAMGVPLAFLYARLDQQTVEIKEDPSYQEALSELEERERERLAEIGERQAGGERPERTPSFSWSNFLYALLFVMSLGFAVADSLTPGMEVDLVGLTIESTIVIPISLALLTALVFLFIYQRPRAAVEQAEAAEDESGIPWGIIWVIVSGLIFLGIGTGLMFAVRSMGG